MINETVLKQEIDEIINWIREYVKNSGAKGVVIGNSGGKDSATAIALACKALGRENVLAVTMPCNSNPNDEKDAKLVAETFEVENIRLDLSLIYEDLKKEIETSIKKEISKSSSINMKPRMRMISLYAYAQTFNYLVMGTGNLSEALVGYTTKWGDNSSDFNPLANFLMEEVKQIGSYLGVPEKIIKKDPSDGVSGKTDEENLGITYKQISDYIKTGKTEKEAQEIIEKMENASKHKREPIPNYKRKYN